MEVHKKLEDSIENIKKGYCPTVIISSFVAFSHTTFTIYFGVKALLFDLEEINSKALSNIIWCFILNYHLFSSCIINSGIIREGRKILEILNKQLTRERDGKNKKFLILTMKNLKTFPIKFSYGFLTFNYEFIGLVSSNLKFIRNYL